MPTTPIHGWTTPAGSVAAGKADEHMASLADQIETTLTGTYVPKADDDKVTLGAADMRAVGGSPSEGTVGGHTSWLLDASAVEDVSGAVLFPGHWATYDVYVWWYNAGAGSGDVRLFAMKSAYSDGGPPVTGFFGGVTATAGTQNLYKRTQLSTGVSVATSGLSNFGVRRLANDAADTLANDIGVLAIELVKAS